MNKLEQYIVGLLQHHLIYDEMPVQVRRQFLPVHDLPCVTLDVGRVDTEQVHRCTGGTNIFNEIQGNVDSIVYERSCEININLWCNTEDERETISDQIMECFNKEEAGHYTYCSNYDDGTCNTTGESCLAEQGGTARARKNLCPSPMGMGYESLRSSCNIISGSLNVGSPVMLDEYGEHPPLLRNMFRVVAGYYDVYDVGGDLLDDVGIGEIRIE